MDEEDDNDKFITFVKIFVYSILSIYIGSRYDNDTILNLIIFDFMTIHKKVVNNINIHKSIFFKTFSFDD